MRHPFPKTARFNSCLPWFSRGLPFLISVLSLVGCAAFLHISLVESSRQFMEDFRKQNINALASADTLALATRLSSLSSSVHWVCITAEQRGEVFYETKKGRCGQSLLRSAVEVQGSPGSGIGIAFTLQLSPELEIAGILFILLQTVLLASLVFSSKLTERLRGQERMKGEIAFAELAAQVSHDIRSPLAALNVISIRLPELSEDSRILIRSAVGRIQDIANNLLEKNRRSRNSQNPQSSKKKNLENQDATPTEPAQVYLLSSLIEPLISEKRLQFASKNGVEIEDRLGPTSYGLFASVQRNELKRVLSNLINNSVEVLDTQGRVTVSLERLGYERQALSVTDNGPGMPAQVLARLGERGITQGKAEGNGLGLFHAKQSVERWGGTFEVASRPSVGTEVRLILPTQPAPDWFVPELVIESGARVLVLDDDRAIHATWEQLLKTVSQKIEILHFTEASCLEEWVQSHPADPFIALVDYELIGQNVTGLELIEQLGIGQHSVLVTSRYEEAEIVAGCRRTGTRLIPKGLVGQVPIRETEAHVTHLTNDAILLDDDLLIHLTWKASARRVGANLRVFDSADALYTALREEHIRARAIYVDAHLGNGVRGEDVARNLWERGFREIYLTTGYDASRFAKPMPWIKAILGKEPVWDLEKS